MIAASSGGKKDVPEFNLFLRFLLPQCYKSVGTC
jgi:hypothetical protein